MKEGNQRRSSLIGPSTRTCAKRTSMAEAVKAWTSPRRRRRSLFAVRFRGSGTAMLCRYGGTPVRADASM